MKQLATQIGSSHSPQNNDIPIFQIPWWHNVVIITKTKNSDEALFYVQKTIQNNWSRSVLTHHIESNLFKREGKAITNFKTTLPAPQSDLAKETLKDVHKPIGVSEYIITNNLPDEIKYSLPGIEEIEAELSGEGVKMSENVEVKLI